MNFDIKKENFKNLEKGEFMMLHNTETKGIKNTSWQKVQVKCKQSKIYYDEIGNIGEEFNLDFLSI